MAPTSASTTSASTTSASTTSASTASAGAAATPATSQDAIALIEAAAAPRDLFEPGGAMQYRRLARLTHPDTCPGDARAATAFAKLTEFWREHQGDLGTGRVLARGDLANLFLTKRGVLKLTREPADNDLIDRESAALTGLGKRVPERLAAYFPQLIQAQRITDPRTGAERRGNLLGYLDGFRSLAEVGSAFPAGVDPRDAAWMWRRLLVAIGAAHQAGVVHRAILPEHVMIHPAEHGLVLVDWCYAGAPGTPLPAIVGRHRDWYPPELLARGPAGQDADLWLATATMTRLIGGQLPPRLAAFARGCMLANPRHRPDDAWKLLAELDELLGRMYGPRKFRPFAIPAQGS